MQEKLFLVAILTIFLNIYTKFMKIIDLYLPIFIYILISWHLSLTKSKLDTKN